MERMVHIWKIRCSSCSNEFLHEFRASDILRPHIFAELYFKCPICGKKAFDQVRPQGKMHEEEWREKHADMSVSDLQDHGQEPSS